MAINQQDKRNTKRKQDPLFTFAFALISVGVHLPAAAQEEDGSLREHVNRGNQLMSRRQFAAAQAEYEAAKKLEPGNQIVKHNLAELFNNWGVTYFRQKSYAEAISQFQKCLAVMPSHQNAKYNIQLCRRAMQNDGMNPDELPDSASDEKDKAKQDKAAKEDVPKDKKDAAAATASAPPSAESMSVSVGNKTIFTNNTPFVSGSSVFPVYSEKNGAAKATVNVINPAAMAAPGAPTINSSGVAIGNAPAVVTTGGPEQSTPTKNSEPASAPNTQAGQNQNANASPSGEPPKKYNPVAPQNAQASYVPMPATYDSTQPLTYSRGTGDATVSLDEKVSALELKVYGKKHVDLPIMRRIDQLETDYIGQIRSGSMSERVDFLKKSIGQN